jgi:hypothetical protein
MVKNFILKLPEGVRFTPKNPTEWTHLAHRSEDDKIK